MLYDNSFFVGFTAAIFYLHDIWLCFAILYTQVSQKSTND